MIEFKNVSKRYKESFVVKNLSFEFNIGEISIIIGPSGCGKTTTLKMINKLIEPTQGEIFINKKSIFDFDEISLRRSIGYVIQEVGLFPHYTIFQNISLIPNLLGWNKKKIEKRVYEMMELINLPLDYLNKYPKELSGGEKQRVGVARALAGDPDILLMDEPFGAIDPINRKALQDFFIEIQKTLKKTVVFVTHDIIEAIKLGDKILVMKEGSMVQFDKPENILKNPKNSFVEELLGGNRKLLVMSLKKVSNFLKKDFKIIEKSELEKIENFNESVFLIKDQDKVINYVLKDEFLKGRKCIRNIILINENENLLETIILLLNKGEKIAIVKCMERGFMGYVRLDDMIKIFEKEDELSNK